jgi:hypothetical protein
MARIVSGLGNVVCRVRPRGRGTYPDSYTHRHLLGNTTFVQFAHGHDYGPTKPGSDPISVNEK